MEGTRVQVLNDIMKWIKDLKEYQIFWLAGMAGTGKSAIAWSVCSRASKDPEIILGGSFFRSRSTGSVAQRDVRCIIPTLAQLMARQSPEFGTALANELARDPDVLHKQIDAQIAQLLYTPLLTIKDSLEQVLFVIDALDECGGKSTSDNEESHRIVSEMLEALVAFSRLSYRFPVKFLVTSRPEKACGTFLGSRPNLGSPDQEYHYDTLCQLFRDRLCTVLIRRELFGDIRDTSKYLHLDAAP